MRSRLNLPPIERTRSKPLGRIEGLLCKRFGFTTEQATEVARSMGGSPVIVQGLASIYLPIKGMGYGKEDIIEIVAFLKEDATDEANWRNIAALRPRFNGDIKMAWLAYQAGLSYEDIVNMNDAELTEEKLRIMATLRTI